MSIIGIFSGCGSTHAGGAAAPEPLRYDDAVGQEQCLSAGPMVDSLVVDLDPNDRVLLESAMSDGLAVVRYDCGGMQLLRDCRAAGSYGFKATTLKEQVISLETADELSANLPAMGRALAVEMAAELSRGATLDVALAMVGRSKATRATVSEAELVGECQGATHFVRGATLGAFAMAQGTRGQAKAAASVFGASAGGESLSKRLAKQRDGDASACQTASNKATEPPERCTALLRVELKAIAPGASAGAPDVEIRGCPEGFTFKEGKCVVASSNAPRLCNLKDEADCEKQCVAGHADSCAYLGSMYMERNQLGTAAPLFKRGCDGGNLLACHNYGFAHYMGEGVPQDFAKARELFQRVCDAGEPVGCSGLALLYAEGRSVPQSDEKAAELYTLACNGGEMMYGCPFLGQAYAEGKGVPQDLAKARDLLQRACKNQSHNGCLLLERLDGSQQPR